MYRSISSLALMLSIFVGQSAAEDTPTYLLRYELKPGQRLNYNVVHVAKTKTRMQGEEEVSQVHTISNRHLDVQDVVEDAMTFGHVVDSVEMTQQQGDQDEIRWSSLSGDEPPKVFGAIAERIGKQISTITINSRGQEKDRSDDGASKASLGMGSFTIAMPEEPIAIGDTWAIPREIKTRTQEGNVKIIKIRELYELEKVKAGVATLSIKSQPLTPMEDESIRAQVVQQLSNGIIKFDLDAGHMISRELSWDETVVGFQGPNSLMEYRARMTETLTDEVIRTARKPSR